MRQFLKNQKLAVKMMGGFIVTSIITLTVGWMGASSVQRESGSIERIYKRDVQDVSELKQAQIELLRALSAQKNALVSYTPEQREANLKEMLRSHGSFEKLLSNIESHVEAVEKPLLAPILASWETFHKTNEDVAAKLKADQADQAFQLSNGTASQSFQAASEAVQKYVDYRMMESGKEYQASMARNQQARVILFSLAIAGTLIGLAIGWIVARLVAQPITAVVDGLRELAQGDLTRTIDYSGEDEVGILAETYNLLTAKLRQVMQDVQSASNAVEQAVAQISSSAASGQTRNRGSVPTIEETAAAMQGIASTAHQNASLASDAATRFSQASESANHGRAAMKQMIIAVTDINESSRKIAKIIHVMDEIALKTNLLALNAAVEAAHAGDHGRGFAVVAGEVRSLAQRSAEAAKDIAGLIEESVTKAEGGKNLAVRSGEILEEIGNHMLQVSELVSTIASGSQEQRQAIEGATRSISMIDQTMQLNSREVTHLRDVVSYFRTDSHSVTH